MKIQSFTTKLHYLMIAIALMGCDTKIRSFSPNAINQYIPAAVTGTGDAAYFVGYNDDGYKKLFKTKGGFTAQITDINPGGDDPFNVALDNIRFYQGTLVIYTLTTGGADKNAIYGYDGTQTKATLIDEFSGFSFQNSAKTDAWNVINYYYVKDNQLIQLNRKTLQKTVLFSAPNNAAIRSIYYGNIDFYTLNARQYAYLAYQDAGQNHYVALTPAGSVTSMGSTPISSNPSATYGLLNAWADNTSKIALLFDSYTPGAIKLYGISGTHLYHSSFEAEIDNSLNLYAGYTTGYASLTYRKADSSYSAAIFTENGFSQTLNGPDYSWGYNFPYDLTPPYRIQASGPSSNDCFQLDLTNLTFGACI